MHHPLPAAEAAALSLLGADAAVLDDLAALAARTGDDAHAARVVRSDRSGGLVAGSAPPAPATWRAGGPLAPTVGDWVVHDGAEVRAVLARRTALVRADASGRSAAQVLAANVDVVLVCTPLELGARLSRAERLLAVAWASGATPVVVATKADRCPSPDAALAQLAAAAPGVPVIATSLVDGTGLGAVRGLGGPGTTLVVLGPSGVGKSSLANALLGADVLDTAEIREDGKGRHTTAWRELVVLPGGGALVDTPGLRAIGLHGGAGAPDGVRRVYADVDALAADCRFGDCAHTGEPGCAVAAAVERGDLDPDRLERSRRLAREVERQAARTDARLRAELARRSKAARRARPARGGRP